MTNYLARHCFRSCKLYVYTLDWCHLVSKACIYSVTSMNNDDHTFDHAVVDDYHMHNVIEK